MFDAQIRDLRTSWNSSMLAALACALLILFAVAPLPAQTFQDRYDFICSTGCQPINPALVQGSDGNLYGTATNGGAHGFGTIFMVTPLGAYTDLWDFDGVTHGEGPSGLTEIGGTFYGTAFSGGSNDDGTIFSFTPPGTLTVLHSFHGTDGRNPRVPPTLGKDGNLYGLTDTSTYRITLPSGKFTLLPGKPPIDGTSTPLFLASDGNMYSTSFGGGTSGNGTFFSMTTAGHLNVLYNFTAMGNDGAGPGGTLTEVGGNLYGVTTYGGGPADDGTVYEMTLPGAETILHVFNAMTDGARPFGGLLHTSSGNFYGTASSGGSDGDGTVFEMASGGTFGLVIDLTGNTGAAPGNTPNSTLTQHTNGTYYGVTLYGGANGVGNVFSLTPPNIFQTLLVDGPIWVKPGVPVEILGDNLGEVTNVSFAGVQASFQPGSNTYLTAQVPSAAVDGLITVTLTTPFGEQQIESQQSMHILPIITNLDPPSGSVGTQVGIVGGGFAGAKKVTFGGVKATNFTVVSPTLIQAIVPRGAKTGKVTVTTPNGAANSKQTFTVN